MSDIINLAICKIADASQIPTPTLRAVLGRFLAAIHEAEFKCESGNDAFFQTYFALGDEAAWHLLGFVITILETTTETRVEDLKNILLEVAARQDSRMKRYRHVLERWKEEVEYRNLDKE
jgi:hypothetical protein